MSEPEHNQPIDETAGLEKRSERQITSLFLLSSASALALAVVYLRGGQPQLEGLFLGVSLGGVACGLVLFGNRLLPQGPFVDDRHELSSTEAEVEAAEDDLEQGGVLSRRKVIVRSLGLAMGGLGVAALFPIRSLGPRPSGALTRTPWRAGLRLITCCGEFDRVAVSYESTIIVFASPADGQPRSSDRRLT